MKKIYLIIFILILSRIEICFAQDYNNSYEPSWEYYMNDYNKNQFQKPVTQQEFDKALEVVKSYQKKPEKKENKTHWWSRNKKENNSQTNNKSEISEKEKSSDTPASADPLLRLSNNVYINETILYAGFYLISHTKKNDKYYLIFKQGNTNLTEIEAKKTSNEKEPLNQCTIASEVIDNKIVKILYTDKDISLEAYLPIYK